MKTSLFTKKELGHIHRGWIWNSQIGWNYERMQGLGYLTAMLPVIEKLYGNDPEMKAKALRVHSQFFNTQPAMGDIIFGMDIAIEEELRNEVGLNTAASVKTALMGPFAGVGDTIFSMIAGAVFGSIAASMAVEGNALGVALWVAWFVTVLFVLRPIFFEIGYKNGIKLVTTLSAQLNAFTEAASVLGLVVVGGMIPSMVKFPLTSLFFGEKELPLQTYADSIMPGLFPALLTALCYVLLGKKWMNSNKLIWLVIAFAILCTYLGIIK